MLLKSFSCRNLHGYLNHDLVFNDDLTFLTGINGTGKTSVVRGIVALLSPSIPHLTSLDYSSLSLEIEQDSETHRITASLLDGEVTLRCTAVEESLTLPHATASSRGQHRRTKEQDADFYRELEMRYAPHPLFAFLRSIPTPMFLDLERRGMEPVRKRTAWVHTYHAGQSWNVFGGTLEESLADARELAEEVYRLLQARLKDLAQNLRNELIITAFRLEDSSPPSGPITFPPANYRKALDHNESLVKRALHELGIDDTAIMHSVSPFFRRLREVTAALPVAGSDLSELVSKGQEQLTSALMEWIALRPKEQQIRRFIELLERHAADSASESSSIEKYLGVVNKFLQDGGKSLVFAKPGNLRVALPTSKARAVSSLSSGERQIVVILTHLAFNPQAHDANVLIIDEPELSLHVKWQEMFVDAVREVSPTLQLVLATHSPSIIMDRVGNCVDLGQRDGS